MFLDPAGKVLYLNLRSLQRTWLPGAYIGLLCGSGGGVTISEIPAISSYNREGGNEALYTYLKYVHIFFMTDLVKK